MARDPAGRDALMALLEKAEQSGCALRLSLIHYDGCATAPEGREARKKK